MLRCPILNRLAAAALSGLLLVGGLPRLWCACADADCRAECNAEPRLLAPAEKEHACCPHCAAKALAGECSEGRPGVSNSRCPCPVYVAHLVISPAGRDVQVPAAPIAWATTADTDLGRAATPSQFCGGRCVNLPPDDPVSRAQVLLL